MLSGSRPAARVVAHEPYRADWIIEIYCASLWNGIMKMLGEMSEGDLRNPSWMLLLLQLLWWRWSHRDDTFGCFCLQTAIQCQAFEWLNESHCISIRREEKFQCCGRERAKDICLCRCVWHIRVRKWLISLQGVRCKTAELTSGSTRLHFRYPVTTLPNRIADLSLQRTIFAQYFLFC